MLVVLAANGQYPEEKTLKVIVFIGTRNR